MAAKVLRFKVYHNREFDTYNLAFITSDGDEFNLKNDMCARQFEAETGINVPAGRSKIFTMNPRKSVAKKKPLRQARARW